MFDDSNPDNVLVWHIVGDERSERLSPYVFYPTFLEYAHGQIISDLTTNMLRLKVLFTDSAQELEVSRVLFRLTTPDGQPLTEVPYVTIKTEGGDIFHVSYHRNLP